MTSTNRSQTPADGARQRSTNRRKLALVGCSAFAGLAVVFAGLLASNQSAVASDLTGSVVANSDDSTNEPALVMPAPTGGYAVGTRSLELVDHSRSEPGSNGRKPRSLVMQLWYPSARGYGAREPYMPPKVAAFIGASAGLPPSLFTRLKSAAISNASPLRRAGGWPVVLFSTGYGLERQLYTGLVQDVASHGYVVAAIDHPHDASIVEFPDGHAVTIGKVDESENAITNALTVRVADTRYVLDTLTRLDRRSSRSAFSGLLDLDRVGMFGHSLGGATAAAAMLTDPRIDAGLDMDGFLFGKVAKTGLEKPFMLFAADPGYRHQPNLAQFWSHLKGSRYAVDFAGAAHLAFTDLVFLVPQLARMNTAAEQARLQPLIGNINPTVAYAAQRTYVLAFFDQVLKGRRPRPTPTGSLPGVQVTGLETIQPKYRHVQGGLPASAVGSISRTTTHPRETCSGGCTSVPPPERRG